MKNKLLFLAFIVGSTFIVVTIFFQQQRGVSEREILQFNMTVVTAIEDRFRSIVNNPVCQYSEINPPVEGSIPECNWLMKWNVNGTEQLLDAARAEDIYYDSTYPLRPEYIQQQLDGFFQSQGFSSNQETTRVENLATDGSQKNYIFAYESKSLRCSLTIPELLANGRSSYAPPFVVVACIKDK